MKSIVGKLPGRVVFLGTPAEEGGGGKIILIESGALRGVDAAMMAHPTDAEFCTMPALATQHLKLTFHGHGAHAALAPWDGSSALAAVIQTFQSVDAMRLHLRDGSRILSRVGAICTIGPQGRFIKHFWPSSEPDSARSSGRDR